MPKDKEKKGKGEKKDKNDKKDKKQKEDTKKEEDEEEDEAILTVLVTLVNVDYILLSQTPALCEAVKEAVTEVISPIADKKILPEHVKCDIIAGCLKTISTITPPEGGTVQAAHANLEKSDSLVEATQKKLSKVKGIDQVCTNTIDVERDKHQPWNLVIRGIEFDAISANPKLFDKVNESIKRVIAGEAGEGLLEKHIDLVISVGTVIVQAVIHPPEMTSLKNMESQLQTYAGIDHYLETRLNSIGLVEGVEMSEVCHGPIQVQPTNIFATGEKEPIPPGRPDGPTPGFLEVVAKHIHEGYDTQGTSSEINKCFMYQVGIPGSGPGVIFIGELWGWNSGRIRQFADYIATTLNAHCVVPRLFDDPPYQGGTDGDGLPPEYELEAGKSELNELKPWLMKYVWESFKPKLDAAATVLRNGGSKRIACVGFGMGAWLSCHTSAMLAGEYVGSVFAFPSIHTLQELNGAEVETIVQKKLKGPAMFISGDDCPPLYREKELIFDTVMKKHRDAGGRTLDTESYIYPHKHGWLTRGDASDPQVKADVEEAALNMAKFLRKFLWPDPIGADASTLRLMCKEGDDEQVAILLSAGVPAGGKDSVDDLGQTPMHYAARAGQAPPIKLLAEWTADVNEAGGVGRVLPLHWAAGNGDTKCVKMLLSLNAEMEVVDKADQTPLHWAAKNGRVQVVKWLLKCQANMDAVDTSRQTPMHMATWNGKDQVVTLFLSARMELDPEDLRVFTPAERALQRGYIHISQTIESERARREEEEWEAEHGGSPAAGIGKP